MNCKYMTKADVLRLENRLNKARVLLDKTPKTSVYWTRRENLFYRLNWYFLQVEPNYRKAFLAGEIADGLIQRDQAKQLNKLDEWQAQSYRIKNARRMMKATPTIQARYLKFKGD